MISFILEMIGGFLGIFICALVMNLVQIDKNDKSMDYKE